MLTRPSAPKSALALSPEIAPHVRRAMEDLSPLRVKRLFARIRDEDLDLIWADRDYGRPEAMILTHLFVPPVAVRPSVQMEGGGGSKPGSREGSKANSPRGE